MPELPEVEAARRAAHRVAAGRRIVEAHVADDPIVFEGVAPARFRRALVGRRVKAVQRRGKHLWLELDRRPWPCLHFGMTGGIHVTRANPGGAAGRAVRLVSDGRVNRPDWPPRFTKLHLRFAGGGELALADGRRLGRIRLRRDPPSEPPISALGFDAWRALPTPARFHAMLRDRSAPIKAVLLDQSFAAGIGNWIADEVLYQAGVAPKRRASSLSVAEARRLRAKIRSVIGGAVRAGSDGDRFPRWWLFHRRWGHRRGGPSATTVRGEHIRHETVGGRTTAWVPSAQR
ncbi:MAG TPA: DNA-formamidopyrimidine glycosylase family protein [Candidatus Limnocylindria bacterium]|nr:DNA-formamidopyrimidine glycosylase family protein [Candidatus Limnocylindria bacterium]